MNAEALVQRQLEAYNAHDLEEFVACYADDIVVYRLPATTPAIDGLAALTEFYAAERFTLPALRADVVNRMVLGNKVVDHERIHGLREQPFDAVVAYEVVDRLIRRVWMLLAE